MNFGNGLADATEMRIDGDRAFVVSQGMFKLAQMQKAMPHAGERAEMARHQLYCLSAVGYRFFKFVF